MKRTSTRMAGIGSALTSALFLGMAPIFGKQAFLAGFHPLAVVAFRTCLAAILLLFIVLIFRRQYLYIYPAGLLGCGIAGLINGLGSIFYYLALDRLPVSVGQLLYSLYPLFIILWFVIDKQPPSRLTYLRLAISIAGVALLTTSGGQKIDWVGVGSMITASLFYALHLPINQRVLLDIPAPTVTLYTLLAMSVAVLPAYLVFDHSLPPASTNWTPVLGLTLVTFLSRLTLFHGVKKIGGMQTALLGLSEILVTLVVGRIWLRESLESTQWIGALLLCASLLLIGLDRVRPELRRTRTGLLGWLRPPVPPKVTWGPHD